LPGNPPKLKLYSLLARTAIRDGLTLPLRLWHVCRALDRDGRGWVTLAGLLDAWPQSRRTVRTILRRGVGLFWHIPKNNRRGVPASKQRIHLNSLESVCLALATEPGDAIWLDWKQAVNVKSFRASCYAAFFVKERTIARSTLEKLYGKTSQTLRNWEKKARIAKVRNVARASVHDIVDLALSGQRLGIPSQDRKGVWKSGGYMFWQLPSSYTCELQRAAKPRKTASAVRHALSYCGVAGERFYRVFWQNEKAAYRAASKGRTSTPAYFTLTEDELGYKTRVWNHCVSFT
jgi:hypothetical protein